MAWATDLMRTSFPALDKSFSIHPKSLLESDESVSLVPPNKGGKAYIFLMLADDLCTKANFDFLLNGLRSIFIEKKIK